MLGQRRGNRGRKGTNPRHRLNALRLWPTSGCSSREGSIEKAIRYDTHVKPQLSPPAPPPLRRPMATSARRISITPPTTHQRVEPVTEEPANRAVAARGGVAPRAPAPGPVRDRPMRPWLGPPSPGRGRHRRCRPQGRAAAPAQRRLDLVEANSAKQHGRGVEEASKREGTMCWDQGGCKSTRIGVTLGSGGVAVEELGGE
jgi:hypothetical protein